jgi:methionine-rich copper-binding protein CopC
MKQIRLTYGVLAISFLFFSLSTPQAVANSLISTSPAAGSTLKAAPSAVTMSVEFPLMDLGNEIIVTDPSGSRVDDGTLAVVDTEVIVGMNKLSKVGIYTVTYRLLSENDLPLEGTFTFNYTTPAIIVPPTLEPSTPATPVKTGGGDFTTNIFVIGLLVLSFAILVGLGLYARKIFREK